MRIGVVLASLLAVMPAALPCPPAAAAGAPSPRPITLDEALALARNHAPDGIAAAGRVRNARAGVRSSYAALLPSVSLSASSSRSLWGSDDTDTWTYGASLGASMDLFAGGRRLLDVKQSRAGLASAEAGADATGWALDLAVKQRYFDVLAARESEVAALAQVQQAEQQHRAALLRVRAQRATRSDSLRSEIQLRSARLAVEQARTDLASANAGLARAIGSEQPVTAADSLAGETLDLALDEAALAALAADGPEVRQAAAARDAARAALTSAWTRYLPTLSASYSSGGGGFGRSAWPDDVDFRDSGSLRFALSLPLFDQLGREQAIVARDVALDDAEAALRDARLAAVEGLTRHLGAWRVARLALETQTASLAAAEEDLRVQQQRYAIGESTLLDVLTSQTQLDDARLAVIRARYDLRVARARLEALVARGL